MQVFKLGDIVEVVKPGSENRGISSILWELMQLL